MIMNARSRGKQPSIGSSEQSMMGSSEQSMMVVVSNQQSVVVRTLLLLNLIYLCNLQITLGC